MEQVEEKLRGRLFARSASDGYGAAGINRGYEGEGCLALMGGQELSDEDWKTSSQKRGVWEGGGLPPDGKEAPLGRRQKAGLRGGVRCWGSAGFRSHGGKGGFLIGRGSRGGGRVVGRLTSSWGLRGIGVLGLGGWQIRGLGHAPYFVLESDNRGPDLVEGRGGIRHESDEARVGSGAASCV